MKNCDHRKLLMLHPCPTSLSLLPTVYYQACNKTGAHEFALPISSLSFSPSWPSPSCGLVSLIRASQFCILRRISQKSLPSRLPLRSLKFSFSHHRWLGQEEGTFLRFLYPRNHLFAILIVVDPLCRRLRAVSLIWFRTEMYIVFE